MDMMEGLLSRHSVRSFAREPVPDDVLQDMIEAARWAPSCQNRQCWRFIVIRDEAMRRRMATGSGFIGTVNYFIKDAPLIVVACAVPGRSSKLNGQDYYLVDTALAFHQMMLAAWSHGVGSCWLAAFGEQSVKRTLGIPEGVRVVGMSPFGYPSEKTPLLLKAVKSFAGSRKRLDAGDIVCYDSWNM